MEHQQIMQLLGEQLKEQRHHRNLTQKRLGELSDTKTSCICDLEKGKGNPELKTLCKITEALNAELVVRIRKK